MGWGLDFAVLLFDNEQENKMREILKDTVFKTDTEGRSMIINLPGSFFNAEDILSTLDFKNHILKSREGITIANSEFVTERAMPRNFMFSKFLSEVRSGAVKISDFDEETLENFRLVIDMFKGLK